MVNVKGGPEHPISPACDPKSNEDRQCICKVCTCGFHKCPQKHTSIHTKFGDKTISEYCAKYPIWPMPKKFVRKIPPNENANLKISSNTTYSDDFVKHPWGPAPLWQPPIKHDMTSPIETKTTYNVDYWDKSKHMQARTQIPPQKHDRSGKFSGQSLYSVEFKNPGKIPPAKIVRHGDNLGSHGAKFDFDTTYHDDYKKWKMPTKYIHKRVDNLQPIGKIQGPTTYQVDFQNRQIPEKCPVVARGKPSIVCGDHMCY